MLFFFFHLIILFFYYFYSIGKYLLLEKTADLFVEFPNVFLVVQMPITDIQNIKGKLIA